MLEYCESPPGILLQPFIKCFWTLRGTGGAPERILPDGCFELVIHLGDAFTQHGTKQPSTLLIGEVERPTLMQSSPRTDVVGVRFRPGGAAAFFRDIPSHAGGFESASTLMPELEGLAYVPRARRLGVLEQLLLKRVAPPDGYSTVVEARRLMSARTALSVRNVAAQVGVAERTLQRLFERNVGLSPKVFARLMRFHAHLRTPDADVGYVDQSHLHRDFASFAGTTPGRFAREEHQLNDYFTVAVK